MRKIAFSILTFLIFFLIAEGAFRIYLLFNHPNPHREFDSYLGWKIKPNFKTTFNLEGIGIVNFSTKNNGFRKWGNINSDKKKILIVGDSYTAAQQISDGLCYYDYLDSTKFEVFAFGCGGYGTLQERMAIEQFLDTIKPDLIVWQFCHNDLINNSLELERKSTINNMLTKKPYLINGEIIYDHPIENELIKYLIEASKILFWSHLKLNSYLWSKYGSIEENYNRKNPLYKESFETSLALYQQIKSLNYPVIVFSVTTSYGYTEIQEICKQLEFPFINKINNRLDSLINSGSKLDYAPFDWHWNKKGHKEAGLILNEEIDNYL